MNSKSFKKSIFKIFEFILVDFNVLIFYIKYEKEKKKK